MEDSRTMRPLPRRATYREIYVAGSKTRGVGPSFTLVSKVLRFEHGPVRCSILLAGLSSCFGLVFPQYAPITPFWTKNVYPVLLYVGSV